MIIRRQSDRSKDLSERTKDGDRQVELGGGRGGAVEASRMLKQSSNVSRCEKIKNHIFMNSAGILTNFTFFL